MFILRRCDVPLIRCLPKMSPSSSTSNGSQIDTWRRSLTWTRRQFSFDLRPPSTGKMFVWLPAFLTEPDSARYSSGQLLDTLRLKARAIFDGSNFNADPHELKVVVFTVKLFGCTRAIERYLQCVVEGSHLCKYILVGQYRVAKKTAFPFAWC